MIQSMAPKWLSPLLSTLLPTGLAVKGISKMDPSLGSFIQNALSVGYGTDQILDYLREKTEPEETKRLKSVQTALTPEEKNVLKRNEGGEKLQHGISAAAGLAAGLYGLGGGIAGNVASQAVQAAIPGRVPGRTQQNAQAAAASQPQQNAGSKQAGQQQIDPEAYADEFEARQRQQQGAPSQQAQQQGPGQAQQAPSQPGAPSPTNIIEQYSPELFQFLVSEIQKGRPPVEAGALAQLNKKFQTAIRKIEADHQAPFSAILEALFGGGQYGGAANAPSQAKGTMAQAQGQQQQGGGQPMQNLTAALQAAAASRQNRQRS